MKKRSNLYLVIIGCLMIVLSSTTLSYHANASKDEQIVKQLFRVVRKSGWNVPGANQSLVASDVQSISVDGETVTKKRLQTETELLTTEEFFYVKGDSQLQINSIPFALRGLYCYEFANKKFAYEARLVPVQVKDNDTRIYAGAMVILYYFDEDRDGIFETRYGNLSRIKLPEWIRKSESNK